MPQITCPKCQELSKSKILETRPLLESQRNRRRRKCFACGNRFTTYESIAPPEATQDDSIAGKLKTQLGEKAVLHVSLVSQSDIPDSALSIKRANEIAHALGCEAFWHEGTWWAIEEDTQDPVINWLELTPELSQRLSDIYINPQ